MPLPVYNARYLVNHLGETVFQSSQSNNRLTAWTLPLLLLLMQLAMTACSPGTTSTPSPPGVPFLNVELEDNTLYEKGMFQVYLNRTLSGTANDWHCVMTLPFGDAQNACSSTAGNYDEDSDKGQLKLLLNNSEVTLNLDFHELNNILVSLDIGDNNPRPGRARIVSTQMQFQSHMDYQGNKSLLLTLSNVPPLNYVTDASAFDTGDLYVTPASDTSITTLLGGGHQWSANYGGVYQHYRLTPVNNGYPQGLMGYVEYSGALNGVSPNPDLVPGTYQWVICSLGTAPDCRDASITGAYTKSLIISDGYLDPQAASGVVDSNKLYDFNSLPASAGAITFAGNTSLNTDYPTSAATDVAAGPYTISWVSAVQNPTAVDWQAIFTEVDAAGVPVAYSEVRSPRLHNGESGGPVYDSNSTSYSWTLDPDLKIANGSVVRVVLRVSSPIRVYSADTQPFFVSCSSCP
jgi:hypothetical protein